MIENEIFTIDSDIDFNEVALEVFRTQAEEVSVYKKYLSLLKIDVNSIHHYTKIPFLPIQFFKSTTILSEGLPAEIVFTSSGTTGMTTSQHFVAKTQLYERSFISAFEKFYGEASEVAILGLLPSYLERSGSSLIYMVNDLIKRSRIEESGYFLYNHEELYKTLQKLKKSNTKTILFGVTYALLDFIEEYSNVDFPELIVMETGGMKGKRREMVREELHQILKKGYGVNSIHSEYGMTELLSQAYSSGQGVFQTPPWMKILIRDTNDPFHIIGNGKSGAANIIDLANIYSCAFIATQDLGKSFDDGTFEILGRFDHSDIRGCNLLVQ